MKRGRPCICMALFVVFTTYALYACGQESAPSTQAEFPSPQTRPGDFPPVVIRPWRVAVEDTCFLPRPGSVTLGLGVDGYSTFSGERDNLLMPSISVGYFFTKTVSLNFELGVSDVDYSYGDNGFDGSTLAVHDVGGLLMLRKMIWHDSDVMISADVGVGSIHADAGFPKYLEQDEIVRTIGLVTDIRIAPSAFLTLSARYARFANDFLDRTPSRGFNGMNYFVGLKVLF